MSHIEDRWKRDGARSRLRWRARCIGPDAREINRSFATKVLAERFIAEVQKARDAGTWRDPDAGNVTLGKYAAEWLAMQGFDAVTREGVEVRLRLHILPALGDKRLGELAARPSLIQAWVTALPLAPSTARKVFTHLNSIMLAALTDGLVERNPCKGLKLPAVTRRRVEPWTPGQAAAVRSALPPHLRALVDAGAGLGLRQSELFGLAVAEVDFLRRVVHVHQQVKIVAGRLHFAPPKGAKERTVPLAAQTAEALAAHLATFPAAEVTLPWWEPKNRARHGKPHTASLLFTRVSTNVDTPGAHSSREKYAPDNRSVSPGHGQFSTVPFSRPDGTVAALHRAAFNSHVWRPAIKAAGLGAGNGCHMMRHTFASTLVSRGVDVRTVAAFMGHSDGGALVLKTYSHLMPDAAEKARRALESALSASPDGTQTAQTGGNPW